MLKINKDIKLAPEPKTCIDIELWRFTMVNYDSSLGGYMAEIRISEEQAREIVKYMNDKLWEQTT